VLTPIALTSIRAAAVASISEVKATVPVASGNVIVLSALNDPANNVSSFASATLPSKTIPLEVERVSTCSVVVVPVTTKLPAIVTVVEAAPIVNVFAPTPSNIVLLPAVKSISVNPVSVVSAGPPNAIVELPIVIESFTN